MLKLLIMKLCFSHFRTPGQRHRDKGTGATIQRHRHRGNIKWASSRSQEEGYMGLEDKDTGVREQWFDTWAAVQSNDIRAMAQGIDNRG